MILALVMEVALYNVRHYLTICNLLFFSFISRRLEIGLLLQFANKNFQAKGAVIVRDFAGETKKIDSRQVRNITFGKGKKISPVISGAGPCRLQRKIILRHMNSQFWIFPTDSELDVLSRFSSLSWLSNSLIELAAVGNRKNLSDKDILRCRLVYRAFVNGLQIYLKFRSTESHSVTPKRKERRLFRDTFAHMDKQQKRMAVSDMKKMKNHQKNRFDMIIIQRNIDTYLSFIDLMTNLKDEQLTAGMRLLNRIQRRYYGKLDQE